MGMFDCQEKSWTSQVRSVKAAALKYLKEDIAFLYIEDYTIPIPRQPTGP